MPPDNNSLHNNLVLRTNPAVMLDQFQIDPIPRRALMAASATSFLGTLLALSVALFGAGLTLFEELSVSLVSVSSVAAFLLLWLTKQRFFVEIGRVMIFLWGFYLIGNIVNQLLLDASAAISTLAFTIWLPGYYLLVFVVMKTSLARQISWTVFAIVLLLHSLAYITFPTSAFSLDIAVALSTLLLVMQPCVIGLLSSLQSYRSRLELMGFDVNTARLVNNDLRQTLDTAETTRQEIHIARELLHNTINSIDPGVVVFDKTGKLLLANAKFDKTTEILGMPVSVDVSWESLTQHIANSGAKNSHPDDSNETWLETVTRLHTSGGGSCQFELPDGCSLLVFERQWDDGTSVITLSDVTELERNRETISQLHKMEALGRLTGGIAHDFNNLLSIILGNLELTQLQLGDSEELNELLSQTIDQTQKGAGLIRQLLTFARGSELRLSQIDPVDLMEEVIPIVQSAVGEQIKVKLTLTETKSNIQVESDLLQSMILNIALNARGAMPDGGDFTIKISAERLDEVDANEGLVGDYIALSFTDTGCGISSENIQRVFEPFYTTKPVEQGSGLGMSMVYGLVKQLNGGVRIQSKLGSGTTVTLFFPATTTEALQSSESNKSSLRHQFSGNALVVEDNDDLRKISSLRLTKLGFTVIEAVSIAEARDQYATREFVLIFSDVILPDGNGYDLAQEINNINSEISILLTSGYTDMNHETESVDYLPFIQKPHTYTELESALSLLFE